MIQGKVYTLQETAGLLQLTTKSLYNYIKAGKLDAVRIGGRWRVTESALAAMLHTSTGTSAAAGAAHSAE